MVILGFSAIAISQDAENQESNFNQVPEKVMREVVRRVLIYKFRPPKRQKVVYLAKEGIDQSWLPIIPNVEFGLLSDEEIQDKDGGVYFFSKPEFSKGIYNINFAFGDPDCEYVGESWSFRNSKNSVRLWLGGGIGGGCSGGGEFKTPGQLNTYPNELKGYQFFNKGKLKELKLTLSTREDVKKNFGSDCENGCDYDNNWKITISYFGTMHKEITVDNKRIKYVPKADYLERIYSICLIPKQRISFSQVVFPSKFRKYKSFSIGDSFDSRGRLTAAIGTSYETYLDRYGLSFIIFEKVSYTVGEVEKNDRLKGDLISIEYSIPEKIEETMFVEQK